MECLFSLSIVQLDSFYTRSRRDINIYTRETPREIPSYPCNSSRDQKQHLFGNSASLIAIIILEGTYVDIHYMVD